MQLEVYFNDYDYDDDDKYDGFTKLSTYSTIMMMVMDMMEMVGLCRRHMKSLLFCGVMYIFTQFCLL